jgi:signal peptidase I
MQPHLVEGDYVVTEPITASDVRLGDVVTYRFEDRFPTRRVVKRDEDSRIFIFMGDSIPGRLEYVVPFDDVLARVVRRRRGDAWLATTDLAWRWQTARVMVAERARRSAWLRPVRWATRPLRR